MLQIIYINKMIETDNFENGCQSDTKFIDIKIRLTAETEKEIIEEFAKSVGVDVRDVEINEDHTGLRTSKLENQSGHKPSNEQIRLWKQGKIDLYCCSYDCLVDQINIYTFKGE